jgi:hypothetical protein
VASVERHYRLWLLIVWIGGVVAALAVNRDHIANFQFWDPDDVMRLLEVRDWLNGQSWFDVSQHRMNWPDGLAMHWSRLVDLPLAGSMKLFEPLVGQRAAETIAATLVPMATLGATMALIGRITRHLWGAAAGLLAAALCLFSIGTWYAMQPMRIDHHGWQIVAGLAIVRALVARQDRQGAFVAGLCAAMWTHISIEGLAFTICAAAWLTWQGIADAPRRMLLPLFLAAFFAMAACLYVVTHGVSPPYRSFCDQISPIHLAMFGLAALASAALAGAPVGRLLRIGGLAMIAAACAVLYRLGAPQCMGGPFATLGPLGYKLWYLNVQEGVPLWRAGAATILSWGLFPWIGLAGAVATIARPATRQAGTLAYCALLTAAILIALLVTRAGAFANLLAIPGATGLILLTFRKTELWPIAGRIVARAAAMIMLSPLIGSVAPALIAHDRGEPARTEHRTPGCGLIDAVAPLDRFTATTILAPLELGPVLVAGTHHRVVTGPYHRDAAALEDVLRFFTQADARAIAARRHAGLLAFCPGPGEMKAMAKFAPNGLAARLLDGAAPDWLQPLPAPGTSGLKLYRIVN